MNRAGSSFGRNASHLNASGADEGGVTSVRCTAEHRGDASASAYTCAPPITKTRSTFRWCSSEASVSSASSRLSRRSTPSGSTSTSLPFSGAAFSLVASRIAPDLDKTTLSLPGRGRNLAGMDSQVFLPITTALRRPGSSVCAVRDLKYAMSLGSRQGSWPSRPMPISSLVAATTTWKSRAVEAMATVEGCLEDWLDDLPDRQREILARRFGLMGYEASTLEVVGEEVGLTRERVRQIQIDALARLKRAAQRDGLSEEELLV